MPTLTVKSPDGRSRKVALYKQLTSVGKGADHDVQLEDPKVGDSALHIQGQGQSWRLGSLGGGGFTVNGRRKDAHDLADGDVIRLGETELVF